LKDLYNADYDSAEEGRCCKAITIYEFALRKCWGKECLLEHKKNIFKPPTTLDLDKDQLLANHCFQLFNYQEENIRFCSRSRDDLMKLKNTISLSVLRDAVPNVDLNQLIGKSIYFIHLINS